jgi:hypothetical protein
METSDKLWAAYDKGFAAGYAKCKEDAAKLFPVYPYPDCPVQMTYQEAHDSIRALPIPGRECDCNMKPPMLGHTHSGEVKNEHSA